MPRVSNAKDVYVTHELRERKPVPERERVRERERKKETKRELILLPIDRLSVILVSPYYADWNITLQIPLLEYPTHLTQLLDHQPQSQPECHSPRRIKTGIKSCNNVV